MEKVIQIFALQGIPTEYLALTDEGRIFRRYGLIDSPDSQWELIDAPLLNQKPKDREFKPEDSKVIVVDEVIAGEK